VRIPACPFFREIAPPATARVLALFSALALFFGASPNASALDPTRSVFQYRCENWSRGNGLPVSSVNAIAQTKDGYLWLGTQQGLIRFDGEEFAPFPVTRTAMFVSQNISTLAAANDGGLWFGLKEGAVGHFDGHAFAPLAAPWVEPNMQVHAVRETRDHSLWVTWNFGYARLPADRGPVAPSEKNIGFVAYHALYEDNGGRVWVAAGDHGPVYYFNHGERKTFPDPNLAKDYIFALAQDHDGHIWMGYQEGLLCYDAQFHPVPLPELGQLAQVNTLLVDRHGVLWIGTEGDGLVRYANGKFTRFNATHGLVNDHVNALFEDAEGNLWVGTRGGLTQLSDLKFATYSASEGVPGEPLAVAAAGGNAVWAATTKGICRLGPEGAKTYSTEDGFSNPYIKRVWQARNGDVYATDGDRHLLIFAGGKVVAQFQQKEWPVGITEDDQGVIVAFAGEICRVTRTSITPFTYKNGAAPPIVWAVNLWPARDGALWVASHRGIWRIKDGEYQQWSTAQGLTSSVVNWIFEDEQGVVWAGLASGVARIKHGELRCVSRNEGLFDNFIYAIAPDPFGWMWFDSSAGVFRVRRDALDAVLDRRQTRLNCEGFAGQDAVKSNDKHSQEPTMARTADGRIWFPTAGGVIAIDPAHIPTNTVPPPVYLQSMRVNGAPVSAENAGRIRAGRGDLEFHYTALSYAAPEKIRYRYLLEGYDERWIDAGGRRSAYYTNLKPGHYRFRVQACNGDGVWNMRGDAVDVTLPPRVYQTAWFRFALSAAIAAALLGAYAWRVRALRRRERDLQRLNEQLEAMVQARTAELATTNGQLQDEIAERKRYGREAELMNKQLVVASREAGMAEVATSVLHNVGNVLNSVNVSVSMIGARLRENRFDALTKLAAVLAENAALQADEKGRKIPGYLERLAQHLAEEQAAMARELISLRKNVEHIKDIVQMQQNYSRMHATREQVRLGELTEDAIRLSGVGLGHRNLRIVRDVDPELSLLIDKPKVLQVLVNFLRNASHACLDADRADGTIVVRVARTATGQVEFAVKDNGVGIAPETLGRLFAQGFTTRREGHGYGLHSSALAAKAMGGTVRAESEGLGRGAVFTLELPIPIEEAAVGSDENGAASS